VGRRRLTAEILLAMCQCPAAFRPGDGRGNRLLKTHDYVEQTVGQRCAACLSDYSAVHRTGDDWQQCSVERYDGKR